MGNQEKLSEEALKSVAGGINVNAEFDEKRTLFEAAWKTLKLDEKGYSGMRMAEIFDDWELSGYKQDAIVFLGQYK